MSVRLLGIDSIFSVAGIAPTSDESGRVNLLIMGQGNKEHDGQDLTDTIMIASIDPKDTHSAVLLSLPRDLYFLNTEKMGKGKLNSMYRDYKYYLQFRQGMEEKDAAIETLEELKDEIGRQMDMPIHYAVKVDFIAFVKAVDLIDGVDLDVPYDIVDEEYPDENFGYEPFVIKKGPQHLDGETALKYARSRSTTSDFGRSARQQQLLKVLAHKAKEEKIYKSPKAISEMTSLMKDHVESTMSVREMVGLANIAQELDRSRVITMQLSDRNGLYGEIILPGGFLYAPPRDLFEGKSVLLPVSVPEFPVTWKQLITLKKFLFDTRSLYLQKPTFSVLNAGAPPGSARKLGNELIKFGFTVERIANASIDKLETSLIAESNINEKELTRFWSELLSIPQQPVPDDLPINEQSRITIIIGKDYRFKYFQDL